MTRPIDADKLKEQINNKRVVGRFNVLNLIDNAPTFNPYRPISEETFYKITDAEFDVHDSFWVETPKGKKIEFEKKRPKGTWVYSEEDKEKGYGGYCSNCKCDMPIFLEDWKHKFVETDYCPNCGADMRGGAKNEC